MQSVFTRARKYVERNLAHGLYRRPIAIKSDRAIVSFTFDDFPRSALDTGGALLRSYGLAGTYYVALGLLDGTSPSGVICSRADIAKLLDEGHEIGCHTYDHCHSWNTSPYAFEASINRNRQELQKNFPGQEFHTLSYPISEPRPETKRRAGSHFLACRAGGQVFNRGKADLNQLSAYFLERANGDLGAVKALIRACHKEGGWLIFATHDVAESPSQFGCSPSFFEDVVSFAVKSDAHVLPVARALKLIQEQNLPASEASANA